MSDRCACGHPAEDHYDDGVCARMSVCQCPGYLPDKLARQLAAGDALADAASKVRQMLGFCSEAVTGSLWVTSLDATLAAYREARRG